MKTETLESDEQVFYPAALPLFVLLSFLAVVALLGLLVLVQKQGIVLVAIAAAGVVVVGMTFIWSRRIAKAHPVYVRSTGLRVYGLRGGPAIDHHWLEWSDIAQVSRFRLPFNPCLILRRNLDPRRYWIPERLEDCESFRGLVQQHAGQTHPLVLILDQ